MLSKLHHYNIQPVCMTFTFDVWEDIILHYIHDEQTARKEKKWMDMLHNF